jgi:hypothetical protein
MLELLASCNAPTPTPTTDCNKRMRDTEALSSSSSGVPSSGQASSKGMFNINTSNLQIHAQLAKRRRIEQERATKIKAANESSEVSSGGATSSSPLTNQNSTTTQVSGKTAAARTTTLISLLTDEEIEVSVSMYDMIYDMYMY